MTVLAPAFWIALALAALPVLIHLLGRRRLKRQPFSSLEFLRRLQTKRMRKLRLKQILLLILRTLAVLALAAAFLRPALKAAGVGGAGSSATVIVADLSSSMTAQRNGSRPLDQLRDTARQIWLAGGEVGFVPADADGDRDVSLRPATGDVPRWLREFETDGRPACLAPAVSRALGLLDASTAASKEIILLSDFASDPDSLPPLPDDVRLWRVPLADEGVPNVAVTGVTFGDVLLRPGTTGTLELRVRQYGGVEPVPVLATVTLAGRVVAEGEITVPEQGDATREFAFRVPESGRHDGTVSLDLTDALLDDNDRPFVLTVPGERRVLLAGDDIGGLRYAELALNPDNQPGVFDLEVRPGPLRNIPRFGDYDALLLAGATSPTPADARRLRQFVEQGGGLWLLLGENADLAAWSRTLLPELGFGGLVEQGRASGVRSWESFDRGHPALAGLLEGEGRYERPQVRRIYSTAAGEGGSVLVRLSDGSPFLLQRPVGQGRVWFAPTALDRRWTDWPLVGVFAPMLQQGVLWLAGGESVARQITCGDPLLWPVPETVRTASGASGDVIAPGDNHLPATPAVRGGRQVWVTSATRWPGHYELYVDDRRVDVAAATLSPAESDLAVRDTGWAGQTLAPREDEALADTLVRARVGKELTPWLLLIALLALIAETVVARDRKQDSPTDAGELVSG